MMSQFRPFLCESWLGHARSRSLGCRISLQGYRIHITKIHQETREWHIYMYTHDTYIYIYIYVGFYQFMIWYYMKSYQLSQHYQTYTQGLELPQDRQGLPHDLRSLLTFHFLIIYNHIWKSPQQLQRGAWPAGTFPGRLSAALGHGSQRMQPGPCRNREQQGCGDQGWAGQGSSMHQSRDKKAWLPGRCNTMCHQELAGLRPNPMGHDKCPAARIVQLHAIHIRI